MHPVLQQAAQRAILSCGGTRGDGLQAGVRRRVSAGRVPTSPTPLHLRRLMANSLRTVPNQMFGEGGETRMAAPKPERRVIHPMVQARLAGQLGGLWKWF